MVSYPSLHNLVNGIEPVGERCGAGLQNDRRFNLMQVTGAHRRYGVPADAGCHLTCTEAFASPGAEYDLGSTAYDLAGVP